MATAMLLLMMAIGFEVVATATLPRTDGFTSPAWSAFVVGGYAISIWLLAIVVRTLPVSVAYAIWSGVGTAVVALAGYMFLDEPMGWAKVAFLSLIVTGVVGLNLVGTH